MGNVHYFYFYYITFRVAKRFLFNKSADQQQTSIFYLGEMRGFVGTHAIIISREVMKMLRYCIIRMWSGRVCKYNGSTWSLILRSQPYAVLELSRFLTKKIEIVFFEVKMRSKLLEHVLLVTKAN